MPPKDIKDLTSRQLQDYVDSFLPQYLGKTRDIALPGVEQNPDPYNRMTMLHLLHLTVPRLLVEKGEVAENKNMVIMGILADKEGYVFREYADEALIIDLVRCGYRYDAKDGFEYIGDNADDPRNGLFSLGALPHCPTMYSSSSSEEI